MQKCAFKTDLKNKHSMPCEAPATVRVRHGGGDFTDCCPDHEASVIARRPRASTGRKTRKR